jgi:hypothetical protein
MYEIVVDEKVVDTVANVVLASNYVSFYRQQGRAAYYRAVLRKVA